MKLTQRDKIVLSALVIVLSLFCGIWFILRPAFKDVQASKQEYNELRSDYQEKQKQVEEKANIKNEVMDMHKECVDLAERFYGSTPSFDVAELVYNLIEECDITVTSLSFTQSAKQLQAYSYQPSNSIVVPIDDYANINGETDETVTVTAVPPQSIGCFSFNIGFDHLTRDKVFELVESLKSSDQQTLIVTSLSFNVIEADSDEGYSGIISLDLYYLNAPAAPVFED